MARAELLPDDIRVFERGWLSSNNILLHPADGASDGAVLVDSGYVAHAPQTLALIQQALTEAAGAGRSGRLGHLVNTHCHSDHMGGNAAVRAAHGCRVSLPAGEAPLIDAWDESALMLAFADQRAARFRYDGTFAHSDVLQLAGRQWQVIAAPGHDTHAVMFWEPRTRVLISGDALWENGFGVVFPQMYGRPQALDETRSTLETIERLSPRVVIPGHGRVFDGVGAALARAYSRVESFRGDDPRLARHCVKVMLVFSLLERRAIRLADLPAYLDRVPIIGDLNRRFLRMPIGALADWLVKDLARAGALEIIDGALVPKVGA